MSHRTYYEITRDNTQVASTIEGDSRRVGLLLTGHQIDVVDIVLCDDFQLVRAQLGHSQGWISLLLSVSFTNWEWFDGYHECSFHLNLLHIEGVDQFCFKASLVSLTCLARCSALSNVFLLCFANYRRGEEFCSE